ncbi:MAG: hypothetical protein H5T84_00035, partial [Thermoleophilia bacterium]|nr:hypothetical protein [Thermoleophilia bacterium]
MRRPTESAFPLMERFLSALKESAGRGVVVRPHEVAREIAQLVTAGSAEKGPKVGSEANNSVLVAVDPALSGL